MRKVSSGLTFLNSVLLSAMSLSLELKTWDLKTVLGKNALALLSLFQHSCISWSTKIVCFEFIGIGHNLRWFCLDRLLACPSSEEKNEAFSQQETLKGSMGKWYFSLFVGLVEHFLHSEFQFSVGVTGSCLKSDGHN